MNNSGMSGLPGANPMGDTMEFMKNLWGSMKIPGMGMPSMSAEDINKQITDLKAVESWLQMNMNMLRSTIQTLEVQSATLSALQAMSDSFTQATAPRAASNDAPPFESPFQSRPQASEFHEPAAKAAEAPAGMPDTSAISAQFANPAVWWNAMQEQFSNAVSQAVKPSANAKKKTAAGNTVKKKTAAKKSTAAAKKRAPAKKAAVKKDGI